MENIWIKWLKSTEAWTSLSTKWPNISKKWMRDKTNSCLSSKKSYSKEFRSMPILFLGMLWESIMYQVLIFMVAILQMTGLRVMKNQLKALKRRRSHNRKLHKRSRSRKNLNTSLTIVILRTKTRRFPSTMMRIAIISDTVNLPTPKNSKKINWTNLLKKRSKI